MVNVLRATAIAVALCAVSPCFPLGYRTSFMNLPAATEAFETRYDLDGDNRTDVLALFQRRILIFFQRSANTIPSIPDVEIGAGMPIPETYAAISVGKVTADRGLQLLFIGANGVDYLTMDELRGDPTKPREPRQLISQTFDITSEQNLRFIDAALDTTRRKKCDIIMPNSDQLEFYRADSEGRYSAAAKVFMPLRTVQHTALRSEPPVLGSSFLAPMGGLGMVRTRPQLNQWLGIQFAADTFSDPFLLIDFNLDGRYDVVTPKRVLYQTPGGEFSSTASEAYSRIASSVALHKSRLVVAPNLLDFNGDGVLDTFKVETTAAKFSPRTDVSFFLGRSDRSFPEQPDFVLKTRDFSYSEVIPVGDVNTDGCQDIALLHLDFQPSSASSQLKAYIRNGLDGNLRFYLWDRSRNRFPGTFDFTHRLQVSYEIYGTRQLFQQQIVIDHDMDGDRLPDLVLKTGARQISVHRNLGGNRGFSRKPDATVSTPTRFSSIQVQDLNGDKRGDILINGYTEDQEDRIIYSFFLSQ